MASRITRNFGPRSADRDPQSRHHRHETVVRVLLPEGDVGYPVVYDREGRWIRHQRIPARVHRMMSVSRSGYFMATLSEDRWVFGDRVSDQEW